MKSYKIECYLCGETDPTKFFNDKGRPSGLSSRCKTCSRIQSRERQGFRRTFLAELRKRGCAVCGETDVAVLEFHHVDPSQRSFNVAGSGQRTAWWKFFDEVAKCILLCANCHKRAHYYNWNLSEMPQFDRQEVEELFDQLWSLKSLDIS